MFLRPVSDLLDDASITEIMINSPDNIYIERKGKLVQVPNRFPDERTLDAAAQYICQVAGKRLTPEMPRVDARLPDGSRVHIVGRPISREGTCITIRRFPAKTLRGEDLLRFGSISEVGLRFLKTCVHCHRNLLVSGGTGSGKTSLLNVISEFVADDERVLVIEDVSELQIQKEHTVRLEARSADEKGRGAVPIRELFHSALRMRPDRVIIGEIRAGEALDLIQAMTSGHSGAMGTVHATTPRDALSRMETLCLYAESGLPLVAVRAQVGSALEIVVQTSRLRDGSRKITEIAEILPIDEKGDYRINSLFEFDVEGIDSEGQIIGSMKPTGNFPTFFERARKEGYELEKEWFQP